MTAILQEPGHPQSVAIQTLSNLVESITGSAFEYQPPQRKLSNDKPSQPNLQSQNRDASSSSSNPAGELGTSRRAGGIKTRRAFQGKLTQEALDVGLTPQTRDFGRTPTSLEAPACLHPSPSASASNLGSADETNSPRSMEDEHARDLEEKKRNEEEIKTDLQRLKMIDRLEEEEENQRRQEEIQRQQDQSSSSSNILSANEPAIISGSTESEEHANEIRSPTLSHRSYSTSNYSSEEGQSQEARDIFMTRTSSSSTSSLPEEDYELESKSASEIESTSSQDPPDESLEFLRTVFPLSSKSSLRTALEASDGDVSLALDLLTAQALVEEEEIALDRERNHASPSAFDSGITQDGINGMTWEEIEFRSGSGGKIRSGGKDVGMNDFLLERGTRSLPSSPSLGNSSLASSELKGKKGRNARRKARDEEAALKNGILTSGNGKDSSRTVINLTDVRHGAPIRNKNVPHSRVASSSSSLAGLERSFSSLDSSLPSGMTDEEIARRLNDEERALNGDAPADSPVTDNSWLLTSSVLSQLSTLLELPPSKITSVYNLSSFNLAITFARLLTYSSDQFTLEDLDEMGSAPPGTALGLAKGISGLTGTNQKESEKAFTATKGRQDSTIDLLQLWKTVVEASDPKTLPDELDPLGRLRDDGARKANSTALVSNPNVNSVDVAGNVGRFSSVGPGFPSLGSGSTSSTASSTGAASQYARAALRNSSTNAFASPAALALASGASVVSLPAASSRIANPADLNILSTSGNDSNLLELSYAECRAKEESYRLRANSYRQSAGQAVRKASGGSNSANGLGSGGIAWYYANEVTKMDNMRYEWGKRAALALVRDRQRSSSSNLNSNSSHLGSYSSSDINFRTRSSSRNVVDLHGLTKQESFSVIEKCLNTWWSQPSSSNGGGLQPFSIITGAGRHSRGGVSILKPAIKKWLDHNGWRIGRDTDEGVLRVVGVK